MLHLGGALAAEKYFGATNLAIPFSFGQAGVAFFFVLSGFIISHVHQPDIGRPEALLPYVLKRCIRIYIPYWLIFIPVYAAAISVPSLRGTVPTDFLTVTKSLILVPQNPDLVGGTGAPVLIVAWTLQYEMAFYFFFSFAIMRWWLGIVLSILMGANYFFCQENLCSFPSKFFASEWMLLFFIGIGVARLCYLKIKLPHPNHVALIGVGAFFAVAAFEVTCGSQSFFIDRILLYGLSSGIAILGLVRSEDQGLMASTPKWLVSAGGASFILYLIHFPLISLICKIAVSFGVRGYAGALLSGLGILLCCIAFATVLHKYVEKPLLKWSAGTLSVNSGAKSM